MSTYSVRVVRHTPLLMSLNDEELSGLFATPEHERVKYIDNLREKRKNTGYGIYSWERRGPSDDAYQKELIETVEIKRINPD
jgi:hypothetical protein